MRAGLSCLTLRSYKHSSQNRPEPSSCSRMIYRGPAGGGEHEQATVPSSRSLSLTHALTHAHTHVDPWCEYFGFVAAMFLCDFEKTTNHEPMRHIMTQTDVAVERGAGTLRSARRGRGGGSIFGLEEGIPSLRMVRSTGRRLWWRLLGVCAGKAGTFWTLRPLLWAPQPARPFKS